MSEHTNMGTPCEKCGHRFHYDDCVVCGQQWPCDAERHRSSPALDGQLVAMVLLEHQVIDPTLVPDVQRIVAETLAAARTETP